MSGSSLSCWRPNCGRFDQARVYCGRISPVIFMFCFFGISSHAAPPKLIQALQDGDRQVPAPFYFTNPLPRGITSLRFFESSSCRPRGCLPRAVFTSPQLSTGALMPTRTSLSCPAPTTTRYAAAAGTNLRRALDTSTVSCMLLTRSDRLSQALDSSIPGHVPRVSDGRRW